MVRLGLLTVLDAGAFAVYCIALDSFREAQAAIDRDGMTSTSTKGTLTMAPAVKVARDAGKTILDFSREFGMTPASRQRLDVQAPESPNPFHEFLARKTRGGAPGRRPQQGE